MNKDIIKNISIFKTIRFNFHYFKFKDALYLPVVVSRNVKFKKLSGKVILNTVRPAAVKIGFGEVGIIDNKYVRTIWENKGTVIFGDYVDINAGNKIACVGTLSFGDKCHFNGNSDIICWKNIKFGNECLVSWECLFMDTDFHKIYDKHNKSEQINKDENITVGNHVWIGCKSTVLKGSNIPDECVIAACSIVTKKLTQNNAVYVSNKKIKENIIW